MNNPTRDLYAAMNIVAKFIDTDTPILSRRLPVAKRGGEGKNTKLAQNVWFQSVFLHNELNNLSGNYDKVLTDQQILFNWDSEYKANKHVTKVKVGNAIRSGNQSIGNFRTKYRRGMLYNQQIRHFLISLKYDTHGCPVKDGKKKFHYMCLEDIRQKCMECRIADPRFFTDKELNEIRHVAKKRDEVNLWAIPSPAQFVELDRTIPGGIYGKYLLYEDFKIKRTFKGRSKLQ